jgi:hypothetical protein
MNIFHHSKVGAFDYRRSGFHISNDPLPRKEWRARALQYIESQRNPSSGISSFKCSMVYFDDNRWTDSNGKVELMWLLGQVTHNIVLIRENRAEQAVSGLFASTTRLFSTYDLDKGHLKRSDVKPSPKYDYATLAWKYVHNRLTDERHEQVLGILGLPYIVVKYQNLYDGPQDRFMWMMSKLEIQLPFVDPGSVRKLVNEEKDAMIIRFEKDLDLRAF